MMVIFRHFRASPACGTVVYLASFLPDRLVAPLASYCMAKVRGGEEHWQGCADSLCNWRRGGELLEVVLESLRAGLSQPETTGASEKGVRFQTKGANEEIELGVRLLAYLVSHNINRTALLIKEKEKLKEIADLCLTVTSVVEIKLCQESLTIEEGALLTQVRVKLVSKCLQSDFQVLELGGQLSVLLGNPVSDLENLLTWSEAELLRVTSGETDMQHTRAQVETQLLEPFNPLIFR